MNKKFLSAFFVLTLGISSIALSKNDPQGYFDWGVQKISGALKSGAQKVVRSNLEASRQEIGKKVRSLLINYFAAEKDLGVQIGEEWHPVIHKKLSLERVLLKKLLGFSPEEILPIFAQGLGRKAIDYGCQEIFKTLTKDASEGLIDSLTNKIVDSIFQNQGDAAQGASKAKGEAEPKLTRFEVEALSHEIYGKNINKPSEDFELNFDNVQEYISVLFQSKLDDLIRNIAETVVQSASKTAADQVASLAVWGVGTFVPGPGMLKEPLIKGLFGKIGVSDGIQDFTARAGQRIVGNTPSFLTKKNMEVLMKHESSKSESIKVGNDEWEFLTEVKTFDKIKDAISKKASEAATEAAKNASKTVEPLVKEVKETTQALKDTFLPGEFPEEKANGPAFSENSSYLRDMKGNPPLKTDKSQSNWLGAFRGWWSK